MKNKTKWDFKNLNKKQKKQLHTWLRAGIQFIYFLFLPSAFTAAFSGVKSIFTRIGIGKQIEWTSFLSTLVVLCVFTIVFGRFFCGFACSFGTLGDAVHAIYLHVCKKRKKKPISINENITLALTNLKYIVLTAIVLLCYMGVYNRLQGYSPWDVFSMLHAGNFRLGKYTIGIILLIFILIGMAIQERFFCRFLCPLGAVFSLLPVLPWFSLCRDRENCIRGCSACTKRCPSQIELPETGKMEVCGECFQCQKCIDTCPKGNIHCGMSELKGNEVLFTLFRAVLLLFLFLWLGV